MIFTYSQFLLAIVILAFFWMIMDWFFGTLRERGEARRVRKISRECHLCGKIYREKKRVKLSRCPECEGENIRGGNRRLG